MITEMNTGKLNALVREAGAIMLEARDLEHASDMITEKPGAANFVTSYDVRVQNFLIDGLSSLFPDAYFFAEEKENDPAQALEGLSFLIDPIDGTTNFIHHMGVSAVSVALFDKGEAAYGAVYDPYRDELFYAVRGQGAFLNGTPIRVSDRDLSHALVSVGTSPYNRGESREKTFLRMHAVFMQVADLRRGGSAALDVCYVAAGRTDAYFEEELSPWDYAAGSLILREAGGRFTDFRNRVPAFGTKSPVLCSNVKIHEAVLLIINSY